MIITENLDRVMTMSIDNGAHAGIDGGMCIMEAVAFVSGEPWSDHPECACPVIGAFLRTWNDALPDNQRTDLLRPSSRIWLAHDLRRKSNAVARCWLPTG